MKTEHEDFVNDQRLRERGLKRVIKWVAVFWDKDDGWYSVLLHDALEALYQPGFGNYVGGTRVVCIVPIEEGEEEA